VGAVEDDLNRRINQLERTGTVALRDFDRGVIETLHATVQEGKYYVTVKDVDGPPGWPGVPVVFAYPEDVMQEYRLPYILVTRDDISPAMERWEPGATQYRTEAYGALPSTVTFSAGHSVSGYDRVEQLQQATPYDISYTIKILARHRGEVGNRDQVNAILFHCQRIYPPYGKVNVIDSVGDLRTYEAFQEGIANLDNIAEVADRKLGFALTLRVEGELDLHDPITIPTVTHPLTLRTGKR
jgi:hypothetical protein